MGRAAVPGHDVAQDGARERDHAPGAQHLQLGRRLCLYDRSGPVSLVLKSQLLVLCAHAAWMFRHMSIAGSQAMPCVQGL